MIGTSGVLARILAQTRVNVERRKRERPLATLREALDAAPLDAPLDAPGRARQGAGFRDALARPGIGVIAEFKRRSPSAGILREGADPAQIARAYQDAGAAAMSVLTEEENFAGSLSDLRAARGCCSLPLLRKDFVIDPYQLYEAALAGADAILLIVAALAAAEIESLRAQATELGLDTLVEVHDAEELARAVAAGSDLVGVNNRDLRDFSVDVGRTFSLLESVPTGTLVVSESGIATREQVRELERAGVAAVLVGESLMRAEDPGAALAALLG
ncbi:MAG TPA: indole-3-glycerol phosphate synthase TrpC [Solirubrobacteraceae bacterium]|nr:indole-3-glycerol phosphate synthase TrpC [Solirubrobacteraceae bacterium]